MFLPSKHLFQALSFFVLVVFLIFARELTYRSRSIDVGDGSSQHGGSSSSSGVLVSPHWTGGPANATLGFGAIYVVSTDDSAHNASLRRDRLIQAANVSEIELHIPDKPEPTIDDIARFEVALAHTGNRLVGNGTALAWLSHVRALQSFLSSDAQTALILEDDVDWDIRLRTVQIPRLAEAVRTLSPPESSSYYGDLSGWDVLWIGHCGDWFNKLEDGVGTKYQTPATLERTKHVKYRDETVPDRPDLHPYTKNLLDAIELPEKRRAIHASTHPLCTFGYAVTRASAALIISDIAPLAHPENSAYDMALLHGCTKRGLKCYSLNPELFHHMPGASIIAEKDHRDPKRLAPVDAAGMPQALRRNETSNIGCGFWSGDFSFSRPEELEVLRQEVGRKGRCLKEVCGEEEAKQVKAAAVKAAELGNSTALTSNSTSEMDLAENETKKPQPSSDSDVQDAS
ncbi:uncharacterized protein J3D65DRAFT_614392 [Phyllosticta citribraziliensis]|uniref:Glycosyltransferase family 25 protein n=1 Tax=Phyllosticta citribraziliensis TaxID=989973 RepID=A0ABR1M8H4_9PEZI